MRSSPRSSWGLPNREHAAQVLLVSAPTGSAPTTFSYDAAGNTTGELGPDEDIAYTWDPENRLAQVNSAGSVETYTYDAAWGAAEEGRRRCQRQRFLRQACFPCPT